MRRQSDRRLALRPAATAAKAAAVLAVLALLGCASAPVYERPWREARTEHFRVMSELGDDETRQLVEALERFRRVVLAVTNVRGHEPRLPTRVTAFRNGRRRFSPGGNRNTAGFFVPRMRGNEVVLLGHGRVERNAAIQHEYVHFLLRNQGSLRYPPWYDEGLAEFFSSVRVVDDWVHVGRVPPHRIRTLFRSRWMPIAEVVTRRRMTGLEPDQVDMFYGASWALVHYLHFGRPDATNVSAEVTQYLESIERGLAAGPAFEAAFGLELAELDVVLKAYVRAGRFNGYALPRAAFEDLPEPEPEPEPELVVMPPAHVAAELGQLALLVDRRELARELFGAALAADPEAARADAGLGTLAALSGDWAAATERFERALALEPDDAWIHLDFAEALHEQALQTGAPAARRARRARARLVAARREYAASLQLDPELPETLARYGSTFLEPGEDVSRSLESLEEAATLLPSNLEIRLLLATAYLRVGRTDEARASLDAVAAWSTVQAHQQEAQRLLTEIGDEHHP